MSRRTAEGRTCEICRRRLLAGETFSFFDDPVHRKHRRPVCALCQRPARERGWTRTIELPPPIVLPPAPEAGAVPSQPADEAEVAPEPPDRLEPDPQPSPQNPRSAQE
jgi:hypothetical protein